MTPTGFTRPSMMVFSVPFSGSTAATQPVNPAEARGAGVKPTRKIYSVDLADPALVLLTDELVSLDQFIHTNDDTSFYSIAYDEGVSTGYVYRVNTDGTYTTVAQGAWEARGIAFDGVSRIFVSERDVQRIAVVPAC